MFDVPIMTADGFLNYDFTGVAFTLRARDYKDPMCVFIESSIAGQPIVLESNQNHATITQTGIAPTLTGSMGLGGGYVPMVTHERNQIDTSGIGFDGYQRNLDGDVASTIGVNCGMSTGRQGVVLNDQGGSFMSVSEDVTETLRAETHGHPLCEITSRDAPSSEVYENHSQDSRFTGPLDVAPTVAATYGMGGNNQPFVVHENDSDEAHTQLMQAEILNYVVRRLTPLECTRLQGYPDGWVDIGDWIDSTGKKHKDADSPKYKALGNSIAIPPWLWVLSRLNEYCEEKTMASLFDGIGGFPLIWEFLNGKGSAVWQSEVDQFCIAVTKRRFGDE